MWIKIIIKQLSSYDLAFVLTRIVLGRESVRISQFATMNQSIEALTRIDIIRIDI